MTWRCRSNPVAPGSEPGPTPTRSAGDDRGSISIAGALFAMGIVALIGLVLMQGQSLGALSRTREAADNAARAAAQQIDTDHLLATGELRLDPDAAATAARDFATNLDAVAVTAVRVDGATVTVTVAETVEPIGPIGRTRTFTATESATALRGVTEVIE